MPDAEKAYEEALYALAQWVAFLQRELEDRERQRERLRKSASGAQGHGDGDGVAEGSDGAA